MEKSKKWKIQENPRNPGKIQENPGKFRKIQECF
jgi:hypothetical protein